MLLDEATSSLDTDSERQVQDALARLMRGRTSLVIAHRLSTIMDADCIHVIVDGRIVESGDTSAAEAQNGVYAGLCRSQFNDTGLVETAQPPGQAKAAFTAT